MIQKKEVVNSEEQLLQARKEGLKQAQQVDSMQAHGKVLGMDTFSWMNPQVDMLATLLSSFPFSILWVGTYRQIQSCLKMYPELSENIETILIHNSSSMVLDKTALQKIKTIACVDGMENALDLVKTMRLKKGVFIYTDEHEEALKGKQIFEDFVNQYR